MEYTHPLETISSYEDYLDFAKMFNQLVKSSKQIVSDLIKARGSNLHRIALKLGRNGIKPNKDAVNDNRETDRELNKYF